MGRDSNRGEEEHEIRLPHKLLDQIQQKEDRGEYQEDNSRFTQFDYSKSKGKPVSRKEKRQQDRQAKKQKRIKGADSRKIHELPKKAAKHDKKSSSKPTREDPLAQLAALKANKHNKEDPLTQLAELKAKKRKAEKTEDDPLTQLAALKAKKSKNDPLAQLAALKAQKASKKPSQEDDPLAALAAIKAKKNGKSLEIRIVKEDELGDDSDGSDLSEDFDEEDFDEEDLEGLDDDEDEEEDDEADEDEEDEGIEDLEEDNFEGFEDSEEFSELEEEEDPLAKLKALKEAKKAANETKENEKMAKEPKDKSKKSKAKEEPAVLSPQERNIFENDDADMDYYAKKLGLKNGKKSKLSKTDDDDLIGGLLDGIDLDFGGSENEDAMSEIGEEDESNLGEDSEDNSELSDDELEPHVRENPYVAPQEDESEKSDNDDNESTKTSKYIPPALRRKIALESGADSLETLLLRKSIKGPLNRLSEANINTIVMEIDGLYLSNARHSVNEQLTNLVLESIIQQGRLLDTFVYLHATLVAAIYRLQGVEFGAYFIQTLLDKFESSSQDESKNSQKSKEASNLVSLLSSIYLFSIVGSKLLYDIIKVLISDLNEVNAELLLRLIRSSGNQMRSDDPSALKEIVILVNQVSSNLNREAQLNPRTQFLIETITSLKNNKLKINNEANHHLTIRLKKYLSSINNNKFNDPIQVSLDDIHNIETRGKWWLVGSAWKGIETNKSDINSNETDMAISDILDNAEPNWMELARSQRMNTNIRRAIFVSIMSANDYIDAMTKLDKLTLKRAQEREIPRVLIHCTGVEPAWNPYYGVLANKLCENHSFRKTFQFMLWDIIKEFEGGSGDGDGSDDEGEDFFSFDDDIDDEVKLKRVLNLGRFFGFLLSEGSLPLHILRTINFVTASTNTILFMEVLFVTFLDQVGKRSQANSVGGGLSLKLKKMHELKFDEKLLIERTIKAQEQPTLLRGIGYFLKDKVINSDIISGRKQKKRVEWGVEAWTDIIEEFLRGKDY